jgi:predicted nucleic acid-binding protein
MDTEFVVIDTDVVSYLFKGDTRGDLYQPHLNDKLGVLSFMTVAELNLWAAARNWGMKKREELALFLSPYIVIESSRELCLKWAEIRGQINRAGSHLDTADAWIAATALTYDDFPLITHNRDHFARVQNLVVISEA